MPTGSGQGAPPFPLLSGISLHGIGPQSKRLAASAGIEGAGGRCTGNEASQPYHKKSPPGFMTSSPLKSGWKENTTGKPAAHPFYDKNRPSVSAYAQFFGGGGQSGGPPEKIPLTHRLIVARARFTPGGALDRRGDGVGALDRRGYQ